ncbi:MAG: AraC family transcriptional regulator [Pseudomonadota bacterium]
MTTDGLHSPDVAVHFARQALASGIALGLSRERLLAAAGLGEERLQDDVTRISPAQLGALLRYIWEQADDELLGRLAAPHRHGHFNLMARSMTASETLGQALRYACHYQRITSNALRWELEHAQNRARLSLVLVEPVTDHAHFMEEFLLLIWHRFSGWLVGEWIPLSAVGVRWSPPLHRAEYRLMFATEPQFGQARSFLEFDARFLQQPVAKNSRNLRRYLRGLPDEWFMRQRFADSVSGRLSDLLRQDAPPPGLEEAAAQLGMSGRTLHRRLGAEGSSYREVLAGVRRDRAFAMLLQSNCQVREVAQALGMTEPAFSRAFKHWTGRTPLAWRRGQR